MSNELKHTVKSLSFSVIRFVTRKVIAVLPNIVSVILGRLGLTQIIRRSDKVTFTGKVFGTKLKINCQGNYAIERNAAARYLDCSEPFVGISRLGLKDFTMLDIGANVGAYSIGAVGIGAKKVFAIEPGPLINRMKSNIELNNLGNIVVPINIGLASKAGKLRWYEDLNNPGNAHLVSSAKSLAFDKIPTRFGNYFVEVDVVTLDHAAEKYAFPKIDLIKIDVEGMEWEVLSSGKALIERDLPVIVAETHRVASDMMSYDCMTPMFNYLYSLGYESYYYVNNKMSKFIYPNFYMDTFFIHKESYVGNSLRA